MHADLFEHLAFHGHKGFLEDCTITLIYKTDCADSTRREEYWRTVLKTVVWKFHIFMPEMLF